MADYEIEVETLEGKSSNFSTMQGEVAKIGENYNGTSIKEAKEGYNNVASKITKNMGRLTNGYSNSNTWFSDYLSELNSLEASLASFSNESLTELIEFTGTFEDIFGKVTMPAIKTGGDPNCNEKLVPNIDDSLIVSSSSGYVFPFEKGVSAPITSHVGLRSAPTAGASTNHQGTDIGVSYGTPIHAIAGGEVINAGRSDAGGFGNWVKIRQDDGNVVIYGHVSKSDYYSVGDRVEAGDIIANVGSEGISTGPHLHLEMHDADGNLLDSENYFSDCWPS